MATSNQPTSLITILSSIHGRQRRAERKIAKRDLQAALKHGQREVNYNPRTGAPQWRYTFADVVYITDGVREITTWPVPGIGLDVEQIAITQRMKQEHLLACRNLASYPSAWTSHTVIVVDQSGSMRKDDVADGVTRSDAVWLTLAMKFVSERLESGEATSTDVVSVISMNVRARILIDRKPTDWLLFNELVRNLRSAEPIVDGNYGPALDQAEELLHSNRHGSCALALLFLSDGKPSDKPPPGNGTQKDKIARLTSERIAETASRFGRRLTITTVGFGSAGEDFSVLQSMASRCAAFGVRGSFSAPKLDAQALGEVFSALTSTLALTKSELTELGGSHQRPVRDVLREPYNTPDGSLSRDAWYIHRVLRHLRWSRVERVEGSQRKHQ